MIKPIEAILDSVERGDTFPGQSILVSASLIGLTIELIITSIKGGNIIDTYTLSKNLKIDPDNPNRLIIKSHTVTLNSGLYKCKLKMNPNGLRATYGIFTWEIL